MSTKMKLVNDLFTLFYHAVNRISLSLTEPGPKQNAVWHSSFKASKCRQIDAPIWANTSDGGTKACADMAKISISARTVVTKDDILSGKQTKGRHGLDMFTVINIWKSGANWQRIRLHYLRGLWPMRPHNAGLPCGNGWCIGWRTRCWAAWRHHLIKRIWHR